MVVFDNLEDIFKTWRDFSEYSRALVTLATAIGVLVLVIFSLKLTWSIFQSLRLYVFSQCCCRTDYRKKYGDWAVVTGSTDGIGLAMAKDLAARGHSIIVIGRNETKLASTKSLLEAIENVGDVITVRIDLSDESTENFARIRHQIDPENRDIGILINNAGTFPDKFTRFCDGDGQYLHDILNVNVSAVVHLTKMIMPGMLNRGRGLIVNVSSLVGSVTTPYVSVYGPTKSFVDAFSKILQMEYSSDPIDIINLTPGAVVTKLFEATSKFEKPTPFSPTPEDYASSALNAVGTGISNFSGTMAHGFTKVVLNLVNSVGLMPLMLKINLMLNARNVDIPHIKRNNPVREEEIALSNETPQPTHNSTRT